MLEKELSVVVPVAVYTLLGFYLHLLSDPNYSNQRDKISIEDNRIDRRCARAGHVQYPYPARVIHFNKVITSDITISELYAIHNLTCLVAIRSRG
jgi:hypothetical protein